MECFAAASSAKHSVKKARTLAVERAEEAFFPRSVVHISNMSIQCLEIDKEHSLEFCSPQRGRREENVRENVCWSLNGHVCKEVTQFRQCY